MIELDPRLEGLQGRHIRRLRAARGAAGQLRDRARQVVSLIGESGSGKSTIGRMILRLIGDLPTGAISLDGSDVTGLDTKRYYGDVQGIFQDPFSSYNPIFKVDRVFGMIRAGYFHGLAGAAWDDKLHACARVGRAQPAATCSASTRISSRAASSSAC